MVEQAEKKCRKCGKVKPAGEFYAAKGGLLGRRPDCKSCSNSYHNRWARRRYVPKTGRRYRTRGDRAEAAAAGAPDTAL
ncbi:MAG: hypothetical protein ABW250_22595 [Pyrinomonadaceae bacterium]